MEIRIKKSEFNLDQFLMDIINLNNQYECISGEHSIYLQSPYDEDDDISICNFIGSNSHDIICWYSKTVLLKPGHSLFCNFTSSSLDSDDPLQAINGETYDISTFNVDQNEFYFHDTSSIGIMVSGERDDLVFKTANINIPTGCDSGKTLITPFKCEVPIFQKPIEQFILGYMKNKEL